MSPAKLVHVVLATNFANLYAVMFTVESCSWDTEIYESSIDGKSSGCFPSG